MTETTAPLKPGQLVRFARWKALGWAVEPAPRRVLDVRQAEDSGEQEITFTGLAWGPGKHFEVVDECGSCPAWDGAECGGCYLDEQVQP